MTTETESNPPKDVERKRFEITAIPTNRATAGYLHVTRRERVIIVLRTRGPHAIRMEANSVRAAKERFDCLDAVKAEKVWRSRAVDD